MKRKTNLFYNQGVDSTFITFSNYGENLTGNFLTTNTKLFPSKFICLNIKDLNSVKEDFINKLIYYYENKLAFLRDKIEPSERYESINPLGYLLDFLYKENYKDSIVYIGNVCEQDYNGTYTDIICVVQQNSETTYSIVTDENINETESKFAFDEGYDYTKLYGWENEQLPQQYTQDSKGSTLIPIYDNTDNTYNSNCNKVLKIDEKPNDNTEDIEFNVIIPLYDYIDIDDTYEEWIPQKLVGSYTRNVPYGVWFSDNTIKLPYSSVNGRGSWSLCLSTQFKVFPYGTKNPDNYNIEDDAHRATYSQILKRQSLILKDINGMIKAFAQLQMQINELDGKILLLGGEGLSGLTLNNQLRDMTNEISKLQSRVNDIEKDYIIGEDGIV